MKRKVSVIVSLLLILTLSALLSACLSPRSVILLYELNEEENGYTVVGVKNNSKNNKPITEIVVPAEYKGKPVTGIGSNAFADCSALESITLPDTITSLDNFALVTATNSSMGKFRWSVPEVYTGDLSGMVTGDYRIITDNEDFPDGSYREAYIVSSNVSGDISDRLLQGYKFDHDFGKIPSITFQGTKAQWEAIEKASYWNGWNGYTESSTIHCTDGTIEK